MSAVEDREDKSLAEQMSQTQSVAWARPLSKSQVRVAMVLLFVTYVLNFLDRQIINILAEPIRSELGLSDWQLGLMTGSAFALFYALAGIPIARIAEVRSRPTIIACAVSLWSVFTMLCGMAGSFLQMLLFRFGVGVGEAGGVPPAHSLISDYVPRHERAAAMAFFHMGLPFGALCGLAMGGIVADQYGWRVAFIAAGLPGLAVAIAIALWLPEPRKLRGPADQNHSETGANSLAETFHYLLGKRTFRTFLAGATLISMVTYAHQAFTAPFFFRVHGAELAQWSAGLGLGPSGLLGIVLGLMVGFAGSFGLWLGGRLSDRGSARGGTIYCSVTAASLLLFTPIQILAFIVPGIASAFAGLSLAILLASAWIGPVQATIQSVAPANMRATASAILLLAINLIGLGLGPLLLGLLSDWLAGPGGFGPAQGLRWAMIVFTLPALLAAASFWAATPDIDKDIAG